MSTRIYGVSDDLIEVESDSEWEANGEHSCFNQNTILRCDDGTVLLVEYGKVAQRPFGIVDLGIWSIRLIERGSLFDRIDECNDENAEPYSDEARFRDGLRFVSASEWRQGRGRVGEWRKVE